MFQGRFAFVVSFAAVVVAGAVLISASSAAPPAKSPPPATPPAHPSGPAATPSANQPIPSSANIPGPVLNAATKFFGGSDKFKAHKESEGRIVWYDVTGTKDNQQTEATFTEFGDLVRCVKTASTESMPGQARAALMKQHPDARITNVESCELHFFLVTATVDGKTQQWRVFANGAPATFGPQMPASGQTTTGHHDMDKDN